MSGKKAAGVQIGNTIYLSEDKNALMKLADNAECAQFILDKMLERQHRLICRCCREKKENVKDGLCEDCQSDKMIMELRWEREANQGKQT